MKEMRLFEVGFKEDMQDTSYSHKFYVAATDITTAETRARQAVADDHKRWWAEAGRQKAVNPFTGPSGNKERLLKKLDDDLDKLKCLYVAKALDLGRLMV